MANMTPKTREQVYKEQIEKILPKKKFDDITLAEKHRCEGYNEAIDDCRDALLQGKDECPEKCIVCEGAGFHWHEQMREKCMLCNGTGLKTPEEPLFMQAIHKNSKTPEHCEIEKGREWRELCDTAESGRRRINELGKELEKKDIELLTAIRRLNRIREALDW